MCEMCQGKSQRQARRELRRMIERYGWALQYVESAVDEHGIHPAYCYTVGLTAQGRPELVITGRVPEQSAEVLNDLGGWREDGHPLTAGDGYTVGGLGVYLVEVRECESWLLRATDLYGDRVRALQAVWADCRGLLPWESEPGSTLVQPLLGVPPSGRVAS